MPDASPSSLPPLHGASDAASVTTACLEAARQLIAEFSWRLLTESEFTDRATRVLAEAPSTDPRRAGQNVYSLVLYEACQDPARREQAYTELHYYLYRIAYHRWPELAEDAAQEAILLIFRDIGKVSKPGAFLHFAWCKLLHALQRVRPRPREGNELPPDDLILWRQPDDYLAGTEHAHRRAECPVSGERPPWGPAPAYWANAPEDELSDHLWDCLQRIWQDQPRARDQIRAFMWKHHDELSEAEICSRLGKTPAQVQVLRSRAKERLRECLQQKLWSQARRG